MSTSHEKGWGEKKKSSVKWCLTPWPLHASGKNRKKKVFKKNYILPDDINSLQK